MRLFELMNVITPSESQRSVSLTGSKSSITESLVIQSATKAPYTPLEIEQLINRAKSDPKFRA
jgi:hypothetical protein